MRVIDDQGGRSYAIVHTPLVAMNRGEKHRRCRTAALGVRRGGRNIADRKERQLPDCPDAMMRSIRPAHSPPPKTVVANVAATPSVTGVGRRIFRYLFEWI